MESPSLSIFFPCYNDAKTIGDLITRADTVASEFTDDYEIIVVDDGSREGSQGVLEDLRSKFQKLRLIFHPKNLGYGAALHAGFFHATKDWIFYTDGDGQYDVLELRNLLPFTQNGVDLVNGYKIHRNDSWPRIIIGNLYQWIARLLFHFTVRDLSCDFRLIRRRVFDRIQLRHTSGAVCLELVKKLEMSGFRSMDYPVHHYRRPHGKSQFFNVRSLSKTGLDIFQLWWEVKER